MGNTTCCNAEGDASSIGEVSASATNRPLKKAMAGLAADLENGMTIRGVGLNEAKLLQAALRGYLIRRMVANLPQTFKPTRDDIKDSNLDEVPHKLIEHAAKLLKQLGDLTKPDSYGSVEHGPVLFTDGSIYVGEWSHDFNRNGFGIQYWPETMTFYKGSWEDDKYSGKGLLVYPDHSVYKGSFAKGKPSGQGILFYHEGRYEGSWKDGKKNGQGKEAFPDGSTYEGSHFNGKIEGQGIFHWNENHKYEGEWKAGERHGHGVMTWEDGKVFDGYWEENKQHGRGTLIDEGVSKQGEWNKGRRVRWLN